MRLLGLRCSLAIVWWIRAMCTTMRQRLGRAIRDSGIPREQVHVITKYLAGCTYGVAGDVIRAFNTSLLHLGLGYVDTYFVHMPVGVVKH